jgi:hypothetical protein
LLSVSKREEIIQAIIEKCREMSTETVMFHQSIADQLGLHITDQFWFIKNLKNIKKSY